MPAASLKPPRASPSAGALVVAGARTQRFDTLAVEIEAAGGRARSRRVDVLVNERAQDTSGTG